MRKYVRTISGAIAIICALYVGADPGWSSIITFSTFVGGWILLEIRATSESPPFDHIYEPSRASVFYDAIAKTYDARNSQFLRSTHREVIRHVDNHVQALPNWEVLDLGGGTGLLIAHQFATKANGRWISVDWSSGMNSQFKSNMHGVALDFEVHREKVDEYLNHVKYDHEYDVVLVSLLLSSISHGLSWNHVYKHMKPGGLLVVADIADSYSATHPQFAVDVSGRTHALTVRPVNQIQVRNEILNAGLSEIDTQPIRNEDVDYSFVSAFKRPSATSTAPTK